MPTLYVESSQITYCDYTYIYISFLHPHMKSIGVTHETIFVMLIAFVSWIPRPQMEKRANKWATPSMDSRTHFPSWSWGYLSSCRCRAIIFSVNDKHCSFFSFFFFPFYASLHMLVMTQLLCILPDIRNILYRDCFQASRIPVNRNCVFATCSSPQRIFTSSLKGIFSILDVDKAPSRLIVLAS